MKEKQKMKIVFASNNPGKTLELQTLLQEFNLEIIPQTSLGVTEVAETGLTFVENAILKARNASHQTGLPAIADDSGLEVKALQGAPGIYSARYAGENANAKDNINKLLIELENIPDNQRQANFYCVLVFLTHPNDPTPIICEGSWDGFITKQPSGEMGFGYDPVFFDPQENASAAQLPLAKKNVISHRGKALRCLIERLRNSSSLR
jgi:XTP/dITP diphosphohydrolase